MCVAIRPMEADLAILFSEKVGRYVKAKRPFETNSLIVVCNSFQLAFYNEYLTCFWCGRKDDHCQTCPECHQVYFCSTCSPLIHIETGECTLLSTFESLLGYPLPIQGLLAFRLMKNLKGDGQLDSLNSLVGCREDCDEGRQEIAHSFNKIFNSCFPEEEFPEMRFLDLLGKIRRNSFKFGSGLALFPISSMFNHSCSPNAVLTVEYTSPSSAPSASSPEGMSCTLTACVRAIREIEVDEEINISYQPLGLVPTHIRRAILLDKHEFVCQCPACSDDGSLCDGYLLGVNPPTEETEKSEEEGGGEEEEINPAFLELGTLIEIIAEMESEMNRVTAEETDPTVISALLSPIIENHSSIFQYLASLQRLNPFHYLLFQFDALLAEVSLVSRKLDDVGQHTTRWLERLDLLPLLSPLCDIHLQCRIVTLQAEACSDRYLSSNSLYRQQSFQERTIESLKRAIAIATSIYSESYQLVTILAKKLDSVQQCRGDGSSDPQTVAFLELLSSARGDHLTQLGETDNQSPPLIIRLVGFAKGVDYSSDHTLRAANRLIEDLVQFIEETLGSSPCSSLAPQSPVRAYLMWDGDIYSEESFTLLIPEIYARLSGRLQLVSFAQSPSDVNTFKSHWSKCHALRGQQIKLFISPQEAGWDCSKYGEYAVHNHRLQAPTLTFCLGGGPAVAFEYEACVSVSQSDGDGAGEELFHLYDISRRNPQTGDLDSSALLPFLPSRC
jgi:uncharacterized coiled-coil protein SlyX